MTSGIYWIYQISRDRAIYVGSSFRLEERIQAHRRQLKGGKHPNVKLQRTWNKYGSLDFIVATLEKVEQSHLMEREQFWMDAIDPTCNVAIVAGHPCQGRKLPPFTEEHRQRLSEAHKGHPSARKGKILSKETKEKMRNANIGKILSEQQKNNISRALLGKPHSTEHTERQAISRRSHKIELTEEQKERIRIAHTGFRHSEASKEKMKAAMKLRKRKPLSEETKKKISQSLMGRKSGIPMSEEKRAILLAAIKEHWRKWRENNG